MIDARTFVNKYSAFWGMATPTCEHFVRKLNMQYFERVEPPLAESPAINRAFIAEFAFAAFALPHRDAVGAADQISAEHLAETEARTRLSAFNDQRFVLPDALNRVEMAEVREITRRLRSFFTSNVRVLLLRPMFSGCGFVDRSEGDVLKDTTLFEVKTVDRPFRGNDIRQLLMYCALNTLSGGKMIEKIGAYNPRRGISFELEVPLVVGEVSGQTPLELFDTICEVLSSGAISR